MCDLLCVECFPLHRQFYRSYSNCTLDTMYSEPFFPFHLNQPASLHNFVFSHHSRLHANNRCSIKTDRISNVCLIFLVLTMKIKYSLRKRTRTAVLVTMSRSFLFVRFCYFCHDSHSHSEPMWFHCSKCTAFWYVFIYKDDSVTFKFCIC